ncbi:unnamed protein product [Danaus chrysippus]|uniref:(African queen) hypothetical protein n=1 Tax=Danaus chrysippus TaxID=151541 RepID=A0A8J2R3V0_9NEOP|nr:unnamed protein product [Danaus chrysippus]
MSTHTAPELEEQRHRTSGELAGADEEPGVTEEAACYHTARVPPPRAAGREARRMREIIDHSRHRASEIVSRVSSVCVDTGVGDDTGYMTVSVMGTRAWVWWLVVGAACSRELDPGSCVARFDVQRDKIIRTEESREMGARYLSELDVGGRPECLRLCCETDACDVFVFEEKSPGSCYLFSCGPPEDFRCKFTAHGNFSSGVLAISRRLAELQDSERLAEHERELANLRSPTSTTVTTTLAASRTEPPPPHVEPPHLPHLPQPPQLPTARRCSRYQFECRRGGECIAVYNACDGVPQCADGSDEAPELDCPTSPPPPPPAAPPASAVPPTPPHTTPAPVPSRPPPLTQALSDNRFPGVVPAEGDLLDGAESWPRRLAQAQPHRYAGGGVAGAGGSHIFSHKGGLLQENSFDPALSPSWPRRTWSPQLTAPVSDMEPERAWSGYGRDWPDVEPRRAWPVARPETDVQMYLSSKTMPEMPMIYSSQQQTLRDGPKKGFEIMNKNVLDFPSEPPPRSTLDRREENRPVVIENTTKKKVLQEKEVDSKNEHQKVVASRVPAPSGAEAGGGAGEAREPAALQAHTRWTNDEHDGLSEHPPAAVLLLVLGSLLTACLAGLGVCRARASRRRRRSHPRLALDADYLVNGMYLLVLLFCRTVSCESVELCHVPIRQRHYLMNNQPAVGDDTS